jgi:hypothetical protein
MGLSLPITDMIATRGSSGRQACDCQSIKNGNMSKQLSELIIELQYAQQGDRDMDVSIALLMGYERKKVAVATDEGTKARKLWFHPKRDNPVRIPRYTTNIDAARQLCIDLVPRSSAGFTWRPGAATAQINDGPVVSAFTPALALCVAALTAKHLMSVDSNV